MDERKGVNERSLVHEYDPKADLIKILRFDHMHQTALGVCKQCLMYLYKTEKKH